jgi:addiction module RelE/StbE family toxin
MPRLLESEHFLKSAQKLPKHQQQKLADLIEHLRTNPKDPLLHAKKLSGKMSAWHSFRITRDWRVVFEFLSEETILLLKVAHRKDIYR